MYIDSFTIHVQIADIFENTTKDVEKRFDT